MNENEEYKVNGQQIIDGFLDEIVICKHCNLPEYNGKMYWLNGRCECRDCYKVHYEVVHKKPYTWDDLDGKRPTLEEYQQQQKERGE